MLYLELMWSYFEQVTCKAYELVLDIWWVQAKLFPLEICCFIITQ